MSKNNQSRSGLGTVQRDFGPSSSLPPPKSSQEIPWPPTPPAAPAQPTRVLSASEKRLKQIQDALAGYSKPEPTPAPVTAAAPLRNSTTTNKRPSPTGESSADVPLPKRTKRILPPDWHHNDALSRSSGFTSSSKSSSSIGQTSSTTSTASTAPASKGKLPTIFLSQEQTQILRLVQEGDSVFYTGSAGTGKSVLLREIIKTLRKKFVKTPDAIAITASTGIAACNIGGVTIHSFAGIGLGIESPKDLATKIRKNKKAATRWCRTKVLIIDEVSMVDGDLFDKLAAIACDIRKNPAPFGGIQLIVTGDFFQLPPVTKGSAQVKFAFEAEQWRTCVKHTFNLTKVFRQSDQTFVDMLNEMRFGNLSQKSISAFRSLSRNVEYDDGIGPTELFPRREDVERSNSTRMSRLTTEQLTYMSTDAGSIQDPIQKEKMLANFMAPQRLVLRVDAQVMLIKNMDEMLVNGSMGRVMRFVDPSVYGTELDRDGAGDVSVVGASKQIANVGSGAKKASASVAKPKLYPVVEFILPHGGKRRALIMPDIWKVELPSGEIQVSRTQLPLILSWAMSIHKSQGQTLDRVKVDLGKVFEKGQAYVALSRATSLEGLQVLHFDPSKVQAHPKVIAWSRTLSTIADNS